MSVDELDRLSDSMKKLRMEYDKYFMGLERLEPVKAREEVKKTMRRLLAEPANRGTARRFRLQSLQASMLTYESHWNRICRQIEEGTYQRDKLRAEAMLAAGDKPEKVAKDQSPTSTTAKNGDDIEYPETIRKLHDAFEQARLQLGGTAKPIAIATLAATVQKQIVALQQQYHCKTVEFKVAIKDGKPILKAIPK